MIEVDDIDQVVENSFKNFHVVARLRRLEGLL